MHVRVIVEVAGMGVQHANGPGLALKLFVVAGEGLQGFPSAACQQVVDDTLMLPSQGPELFGQGEGD